MKFAATSFSILPTGPTKLSGLEAREDDAPFLGISECKLRMAWLENEGQHLLFILTDLLFFPDWLAGQLEEYVQKKYNIPEHQLLLAGTHNHSGPALGFLPWEEPNLAYERKVFEKIKEALVSLQNELKETEIQITDIDAPPVSVNRRKRIRHWRKGFANKALMLPNPSGPKSEKIKMVKFITPDEQPTYFFSYASHPVFNRNKKPSSGYPGSLAQFCEQELGAKEAFWFQGFGGDLRPDFRGGTGLFAKAKSLIYGPEFADYTSEHFTLFCRKIMDAIIAHDPGKKISPDTIRVKNEEIELSSQSGKTCRTLNLTTVSIGEELTWLIANGELFCSYELSLPRGYFPIGCAARSIGYIPVVDEVPWGGYEVEDAPLNNHMDGPMAIEGLKRVEDFFSRLK